jgi:pyruvate,water dikinase
MSTQSLGSPTLVRDDSGRVREDLGGKASALAALSAAGFPVPRWLVVTPEAFDQSSTSSDDDLELDASLVEVLLEELTSLAGGNARFAVRSSALEEDSAEHSFAGQLDTYLFVGRDDVPRRVVDVWRAVLVQVMVDADVSGVAFSADPVSGDRDIAVVGSLFGLGTALVSGDADADTHRIRPDGVIVARELADKNREHVFSSVAPEGVAPVEVPAQRASTWALTDDQAGQVADLARSAEQFFGTPQDIEWALEAGRLYLLQSRPITTLKQLPRPGALNIWDNSNVAESYQGVTTPLTYSFARHAYEGVYTQLCRIFGTPESRIEILRPALRSMIGLIRGRVYYNVLNWYRLLRQCPGYRVNAEFFERMIGLRESVPNDALTPEPDAGKGAKVLEVLRLTRTSVSILGSYLTLNQNVQRFYQRVERALTDCPDLSSLSAEELVSEYRTLVRRLITRWDAPMVNDFFAMVFYGSLHKLCVRWCDDASGSLQNDLLCCAGGIVSTEPVTRMERLADMARTDSSFLEALCHGSVAEIEAAMVSRPLFRRGIEAYLEKFGERCSEELKLESSTLHDDPVSLFRAVGALASRARRERTGTESDQLGHARERVHHALHHNPLKRLLFHWVQANAQRTVRNRENLRLERTRVFGRVRRIFVELGKRLVDLSVLQDPRDVFYLQVDELIAFVEGSAVTVDLAGLAAARRAEFDLYQRQPAPPQRFETRGPVYLDSTGLHRIAAKAESSNEIRNGTGCCPGIVSGPVRVVKDPHAARLEPGTILVAERTDPGWIMLFPLAAGLVVQHGNLLSHSAIVAREMGIPAIVSVDDVTTWLKDGDEVEIDGALGIVRRTHRGGGTS